MNPRTLIVVAVVVVLAWFTSKLTLLVAIVALLVSIWQVLKFLIRRGSRLVKEVPPFASFVLCRPTCLAPSSASHEFRGISNFRDVGGYLTQDGKQRVRQHMLYRSACLANATDADVQQLSDLGVKSVWDLRVDHERNKEPNKFPTSPHVRVSRCVLEAGMTKSELFRHILGVINVTFFNRHLLREGLLPHYHELVRVGAPQMRAFVESLAQADSFPAVIHCTAGKDRTGIMVALVLALLGVPDDAIAYDYSLTNSSSEHLMETLSKSRSLAHLGIPDSDFRGGFVADPAVMSQFLGELRKRNSTLDDFFRTQVGVQQEVLDRIRSILLENE
jgi:protein-tyrosine phosphatase